MLCMSLTTLLLKKIKKQKQVKVLMQRDLVDILYRINGSLS